MTLKSDQGCGTPQDATRKQAYLRLVQLFAPLVYFEPEERFFYQRKVDQALAQ